jgi:hypothetical protein
VATVSSNSMPFPIPPADLAGTRVLLIGVIAPNGRRACFVTGVAQYNGAELQLHRPGEDPAIVASTASALQGFDPAALPRLIVREHRGPVLAQAVGVTACAVIALDAPLPHAIVLDDPFFGLAHDGATGEIFLMQADD